MNSSLSQLSGFCALPHCTKVKRLFCNNKDPSKDVLKEVLEVIVYFSGDSRSVASV